MNSKRFSKVLLVRLAYTDFLGNNLTPPIGLGYIAEALRNAHINYEVFDMGLSAIGHRDFNETNLFEHIGAYKPDLIGITMQSFEYRHHYQLIQRIKDSFPGIHIVLGGHHMSSYREKVLEQCNGIDFGIVLEGEETIVELCKGTPYESVKGLIFRKGDEIIFTGERARIKLLDDIPYPRFEKFQMEKYLSESMGIVTSRGCPYSCTYCSVALSIGRQMGFRSPENIIDEIEYWYKKGKRRVLIYDDNFTLNKKRVFDLCNILRNKDLPGLRFAVPQGIRADKLTKDLLIEMKEVGFELIAIGVESANDDVLKAMKKSEKMEEIDNAVRVATELGFTVILFFIIGMPTETPEGAKNSIRFALKYPVAEAAFFTPIPYPGTELYDQLKDKGYLLKEPEQYLNEFTYNSEEPVFETPDFSVDERKTILAEARKATLKIKVRRKLQKIKRFRTLFYPLAYIASTRTYMRVLNDSLVASRIASILKRIARIS